MQCFEEEASDAVIQGTLRGKLSLFPASAHLLAAAQLHRCGSEDGRRALLRLLEKEANPAQVAQIIAGLGQRDDLRPVVVGSLLMTATLLLNVPAMSGQRVYLGIAAAAAVPVAVNAAPYARNGAEPTPLPLDQPLHVLH